MNDETSSIPREIRRAEAARRRVFHRFLKGVVVWIILLVVTRLWWGREASQRLAQRIESYQKAGEPILLDDFNQRLAVPDDKNAAILYQKAFAGLVKKTATPLGFDDLNLNARTEILYPRSVQAYFTANRPALSLIRQARGLPDADFAGKFQSSMMNALLPWLSQQKALARFCGAMALQQFHAGEHAEAIEMVADIEHIGKCVGRRGNSFLISHLTAIATESIRIHLIEIMAPAMDFRASANEQSHVISPASRPAIEAIQRSLISEEWLRSSWTEAFYSERATGLDFVTSHLNRMKSSGVSLTPNMVNLLDQGLALFFQPVVGLDGVRMLDNYSQFADAGLQSDWRTAKASCPPSDSPEMPLWQSMAHPTSGIMLPSLSRPIDLHFRMLASRRMAAIVIALRLYELDHGRRPSSLTELAPRYLAELPHDPFASDGRPFGYKPDSVPPVLYSIGIDGVDDEGQFGWRESGGIDDEKKDQVFFLDGRRPCVPLKLYETDESLLKAFEDQQQVEDSRGDAD